MSNDENPDPPPYPLPGSTPWYNQRAREDSERAIGRICMAFQQLEESVSGHIARLISRDLHLGTIITAELSFRNKVGLLCSVYLYRAELSAPPEILKTLLARLHSAEERRNTIMHSYWIKSPVCGALTRYKYTAKSGKGFVHQIEDFEPEHIDAIAAQIALVNIDCDAHLSDTFPSCDGRAEMA
jgi:hypothetical protein